MCVIFYETLKNVVRCLCYCYSRWHANNHAIRYSSFWWPMSALMHCCHSLVAISATGHFGQSLAHHAIIEWTKPNGRTRNWHPHIYKSKSMADSLSAARAIKCKFHYNFPHLRAIVLLNDARHAIQILLGLILSLKCLLRVSLVCLKKKHDYIYMDTTTV